MRGYSFRRRRRTHWTTTHDIEEQEIAVGVDHWLIRGTLEITWDYDAHADCDADGNRGHEQTSEDGRCWTLLGAAWISPDGEAQDAERTGADIPQAVYVAAEAWADTYDPSDVEPPEDDDEPPYDREDDKERRARPLANDGGWDG